jgi:hypothetical protein
MSERCQVNRVPASEDIGAPFHVTYEPCGEMAVWRLEEDDGSEVFMCERHQREAGR